MSPELGSNLSMYRALARAASSAACLVFAAIAARFASADAIIVTKAMTADTVVEIFIEQSVVRVELEIGFANLPAFHNLQPDEIRRRMGFEPAPYPERLRTFFIEDLVIRADGGPPLSGRLVEIEPRRRVPRDELTGEPLPAAEDEGEPVVYAVLEYPFSGQPRTLSFSPPKDEKGGPAASVGFITYHLGLPVMDFRYLGAVETVDLDWDDPWFSKFTNRNLWRQYDSPMNVFLYVEPFEVRVEIIARPRDVQKWTHVGVGELKKIPVEMQEEVKRKVADFFAEKINLTIDGQPIEPELDRVNFLERTLRTSTVINPPRDLDAAAATLGVIFLHPTTDYPQEAKVTWSLFPDRVARIPAAATDEAGPLRFFLTPDDNVLWWKNSLRNPQVPTLVEIAPPPTATQRVLIGASWLVAGLLALVVARRLARAARGRAPWTAVATPVVLLLIVATAVFAVDRTTKISDERANEIVSALLTNIYRAFDVRDEDLIYDILDRSLTGDMMVETYLQARHSLELASQGGARAKVKEVEIVTLVTRPEGRGFASRCTWNVAASVGHWGHIHQRRNQYVAELRVAPIDGVWKVTAMELVGQEQL
jgi:hypothetical protein